MRRSLLFIPGNNPAMLQNADVFGADGIILDLEDAVTVAEKDAARELVKEYLNTWEFGATEVMVRVNGLSSGWLGDDLDAVLGDKLTAIVYPKADLASLRELDRILSELERRKGLAKRIGVVPIVESATGVVETDAIATFPRVGGILLGGEDFTADMEIVRTREGAELAYPRAKIAIACRAAGIDAIDTPFADVADAAALERDARVAKSLGFGGKAVIHPNQIEIVNRVFAPDVTELRWARRVVAAAADARKKGLGASSLDGKMIDRPVELRAAKILERAAACGLGGPDDEE